MYSCCGSVHVWHAVVEQDQIVFGTVVVRQSCFQSIRYQVDCLLSTVNIVTSGHHRWNQLNLATEEFYVEESVINYKHSLLSPVSFWSWTENKLYLLWVDCVAIITKLTRSIDCGKLLLNCTHSVNKKTKFGWQFWD